MIQPVHDLTAKVQPDPRGLFVRPAIVPGEALFKHPGLILLPDADAVVGDDHRDTVSVDADGAAGRGVFQGVGEDLFHHEQQPLLVRQHGFPGLLEIQRDFFQNEHLGELPYRLPQDVIQRVFPQNVICGVAVQPQVGEHHLHILPDLQQFHLQLAPVGGHPPAAAGPWRRWAF